MFGEKKMWWKKILSEKIEMAGQTRLAAAAAAAEEEEEEDEYGLENTCNYPP